MAPARGPIADIVEALCASIRSGLSYSGAFTIPKLHRRAEFIQITGAGYREVRPTTCWSAPDRLPACRTRRRRA